jgi:FMN-dependent NADH-azoreductase
MHISKKLNGIREILRFLTHSINRLMVSGEKLEETMNTILHINTSLYSDEGQSSRLAARLVSDLLAQHPGAEVVERDLARDPVPHLDAGRFEAFTTVDAERTSTQRAVVHESDVLIDELRRADVLVLGLPMYNFGIPSTFKAWIDHVARAGVTFSYAESGPVGLLTGKTAYVVSARGGRYAGTDLDTQTPYVRNVLAFIGITDLRFVYAEGLAMGGGVREQTLREARDQIRELALETRPAA